MEPLPEVIVLDVNETLSDLEPMRARLRSVGLPPSALDLWFAATLRDGFALCASGSYAPFRAIAGDVLRTMMTSAGLEATDVVDEILDDFAGLLAHPDVPSGVRALSSLGIRLVTLTNGATAMSDRLLAESGLLEVIEHRLSVDDAGRWKPNADAYLYAARVCDVSPARMALAAVHPWDVGGAQRAGLQGYWINRHSTVYPSVYPAPDAEAPDFCALAKLLTDQRASR